MLFENKISRIMFDNKSIFIISISLIIILITSGCLGSPFDSPFKEQKEIIGIDVRIDVDVNEIGNINYTKAQGGLEKIGYSFENRTTITHNGTNITLHYRYYIINTTRSNGISGFIVATNKSPDCDSFISMRYQKNIPEQRLGPEKDYLKEETKKIAQSCGIHLNWKIAGWGIAH